MATLVGRPLGDDLREVGVEHEQDDDMARERRRLTPYERISNDLMSDQKVMKEITLGKRIGFYRVRGEIGTGNFSQVKLGIHSLLKGTFTPSLAYWVTSGVQSAKMFPVSLQKRWPLKFWIKRN